MHIKLYGILKRKRKTTRKVVTYLVPINCNCYTYASPKYLSATK